MGGSCYPAGRMNKVKELNNSQKVALDKLQKAIDQVIKNNKK